PAARMPRIPILTIAAATAALALTAILSFTVVHAMWSGRASVPPVTGAYITGGVPRSDPAIEKLLADELPDLIVAVDNKRSGGSMAPTDARMPIALITHPAIAAPWAEMVDALFGWLGAPRHGRVYRDASRTLRAKVRAVSDRFAAEGLAYYLQGDVIGDGGRDHAAITAYKVEQVAFVVADGEPRRVLGLRRLDKLNLHRTMLGMQADDLGDPVLLLDQIDHHVTTRLLPTLADNAGYPLGDEWQHSHAGRRLAMAAGAAIRREVRAAFGADADAAAHVGALLDERIRFTDLWRDDLARRQIWMTSTDGLFVPPGLLDRLPGYVPAADLDRIRSIDDELEHLGARRIAARAHDLVAATVRRHEAQHGVDADRSSPLRYPDELSRRVATTDDGFVFRARAELAAYLSQIANDPTTPQLALWNLTRHAFHKDATPESYAAVVVVEGLARHLGIAPRAPVVHDDHIDLAILAELGEPIAAVSGPELRAAAVALWSELYDQPVTVIVDRE
ncbi:MAG TPA: hypothetical protein VGO00_28680, partial [Kofleriaceae bacterium]|nr:hypothetical protein [Kofleriaceae bacterium]